MTRRQLLVALGLAHWRAHCAEGDTRCRAWVATSLWPCWWTGANPRTGNPVLTRPLHAVTDLLQLDEHLLQVLASIGVTISPTGVSPTCSSPPRPQAVHAGQAGGQEPIPSAMAHDIAVKPSAGNSGAYRQGPAGRASSCRTTSPVKYAAPAPRPRSGA